MFALEIEYLTGAVAATSTGNREAAEWPPHPDRLFSAFVAAWGDGGEDPAERRALEWLETLPPPVIEADASELCGERDVVIQWVPPNDTSGKGGTSHDVRDWRGRQPRTLPKLNPADSRVRFRWDDTEAPAEHAATLRALAGRIPYLGHSHSLVRVALAEGEAVLAPPAPARLWRPDPAGKRRLRVIGPGRLRDLIQRHQARRRPAPSDPTPYAPPGSARDPAAPLSVFGDGWIVLSFVEDDAERAAGRAPHPPPALTGFPILAKRLHRALLHHAGQGGAALPPVLSGRDADGAPARDPHLAILPLANLGWDQSDGVLMGIGLCLPRGFGPTSPGADAVRRAVAPAFTTAGLRLGTGERPIILRRDPDEDRYSLDPARYGRSARVWATVTPIVLDRHPKPGQSDEAHEAQIRRACMRIGLPEPREVLLAKHAAITGAPPAWAVGGAPPWADWRFPDESPLIGRHRTHAILVFDRPVAGPVILGCGRFQGMGLCLPLTAWGTNT